MLRKGATFEWTEQCENAFKLLKAELTKIPALQHPNPNKPFKLFTGTFKHSYSGILHQEKEGQADTDEPELIPIAYFSDTFNKTQQLWNTMLYSLQISSKICFLSYRYRLHIVLLPQPYNPFHYYMNVKSCFISMGIRAAAVQHEVWAHPRQEESGSRCNFQAKDIQVISRQ